MQPSNGGAGHGTARHRVSWEFDGGALIAGAIGVVSAVGAFFTLRTRVTELAEDHKALEARVEKVEQLAQAVNALGQRLSQSIEHLGEKFAGELRHMAELQGEHNKSVSQQLTEIRDEQRSFKPQGRPRSRKTQ